MMQQQQQPKVQSSLESVQKAFNRLVSRTGPPPKLTVTTRKRKREEYERLQIVVDASKSKCNYENKEKIHEHEELVADDSVDSDGYKAEMGQGNPKRRKVMAPPPSVVSCKLLGEQHRPTTTAGNLQDVLSLPQSVNPNPYVIGPAPRPSPWVVDAWSRPARATIVAWSRNRSNIESYRQHFAAVEVCENCFVEGKILVELQINLFKRLGKGSYGTTYHASCMGNAKSVVKFTNTTLGSITKLSQVSLVSVNEDRIGRIASDAGIGPKVYKVFYVPCLIKRKILATAKKENNEKKPIGYPSSGLSYCQLSIAESLAKGDGVDYSIGHIQVIVMEQLQMTLYEWMAKHMRHRKPMEEMADLGERLAELFKAMNRINLFHFDLKFDNVMINLTEQMYGESGFRKKIESVKLIDFGLSHCEFSNQHHLQCDAGSGSQLASKVTKDNPWPNPHGYFGWFLIGPTTPNSQFARSYDLITFISKIFDNARRKEVIAEYLRTLAKPLVRLLMANNPTFPIDLIETPERALVPLMPVTYNFDRDHKDRFLKFYGPLVQEFGIAADLKL